MKLPNYPRTRRIIGNGSGGLELGGVTVMSELDAEKTAYTTFSVKRRRTDAMSAMATHSIASMVVTVEDIDAITDEPQANPGLGATTLCVMVIAGDKETFRTYTSYGDEAEGIDTP